MFPLARRRDTLYEQAQLNQAITTFFSVFMFNTHSSHGSNLKNYDMNL
jgi:hypothetical protein